MNLFVAELLIKKPEVKRFCKIDIQDAHRLEAVHLSDYKWQKSEEERLAEEAKKAAEEAAGNEEEA